MDHAHPRIPLASIDEIGSAASVDESDRQAHSTPSLAEPTECAA